MSEKILEFVKEFQELTTLLDQWRGTRVEAIIRRRLTYRHSQFGSLIIYLDRVMNSIQNAEGVWLDYIGDRLGLIRPQIEVPVRVFGFSPQDVGFNQGPFASLAGRATGGTQINDALYKKLLYGRAAFRLSNGSLTDHNKIVRNIFRDEGESASWEDNFDKTATLTTRSPDQYLYRLANNAKLLTPPLGIRRLIPVDQYAFTPGVSEVFRGTITRGAGLNWFGSGGGGVLEDGGFTDSNHTLVTLELIAGGNSLEFFSNTATFDNDITLVSRLIITDAAGIHFTSATGTSNGVNRITYVFNAGDLAQLGTKVSMLIAQQNSAVYKGA